MRDSKTIKKELTALEDIIERIGKIKSFLSTSDEYSFNHNDLLSEATIRQIEIIGEASKRISNTTRNKNPGFPWKEFAGMRDHIVHQYDKVEMRIVWDTAKTELPGYEPIIRQAAENIKKELIRSVLWENLSKDDKNKLKSDHASTAVSQYKNTDCLLQISYDNRLAYLTCKKIIEILNKNPLFDELQLSLKEQEKKDLAYGKTLRFKTKACRFNVVEKKLKVWDIHPSEKESKGFKR